MPSFPLPPEFRARCADTGCSWHVGTMPNRTTTPDEARTYRDDLATQHQNRYPEHTVERSNHT